MGTGTDSGGEILNFLDQVTGQHDLAEARKVEPLVRRASCRTVIEIETVDIDVRFGHCLFSKLDRSLTKESSGRG